MSDHVELRHDGHTTTIHYTVDGMGYTNEADAVRHMGLRWENFTEDDCRRYIRRLPCVQRTIGTPGYATTDREAMPTLLTQLGFLNQLTGCKSKRGVYRPELYTIHDNALTYLVAGTGEDRWGMPREGKPFDLCVMERKADGTDELETIYTVKIAKDFRGHD